MNSCIVCFLKHIYDSNIPIYFNCSHVKDPSYVIVVKKNLLRFYYLLFLCVFAMLVVYAYLLSTNYCSVYTLKCMLLLSDFIYSLIGITVLFLKLITVKWTVLSLNGWSTLYEHKNEFCVEYTSLENETILLKHKRIFFTTIPYSFIVSDAIYTLMFPYVSDLFEMKLVLKVLCAYFQIGMFFEGIQHLSFIGTIYTYFSNSIRNNLLLMLSPDDRVHYYKNTELCFEMERGNSSLLVNLKKIKMFFSAFSKNMNFANMIFRPLAVFWFSETTFLLIVNFYIVVNAKYGNDMLKIVLMACVSIILLTYLIIVSENLKKMVSN